MKKGNTKIVKKGTKKENRRKEGIKKERDKERKREGRDKESTTNKKLEEVTANRQLGTKRKENKYLEIQWGSE